MSTSSAEFFEAKYRANADPWGFAMDAYELQRYDAVMRAVGNHRYLRAFEPGCSVGVLTERMAGVCDEVRACDFSATAVAAARIRTAGLAGVSVQCRGLSADEPWGDFDLIVLCEIGYYFAPNAWAELVDCMVREMRAGAVLVACHWLGRSVDHVQTGEAVHAGLPREQMRQVLREIHDGMDGEAGFLLERWERLG